VTTCNGPDESGKLATIHHHLAKKSSMLAARASAVRNVSRIARSFATVVDTAGFKVATIDYNQPSTAVTLLVKAGSRFESKPGVAHALKNFAFKVRFKRIYELSVYLIWFVHLSG
jgi:hypothetical protein